MSFGDGGNRRGYGGGGGSGFRSGPSSSATPASYQDPHRAAEGQRLEQVITNAVKKVQFNVAQISKIVKQLGGPKDTVSLRSSLRNLVESTKDLAKDTSGNIRKFSELPTDNAKKHRITQQKLMRDFQTRLKEFQEISKISAQQEREHQPKPDPEKDSDWSGISAAGGLQAANQYAVEDDHETERLAELERRRAEFMQVESEREVNTAIIAEREKGIRDVETAVLEVNEIFTDLASLVQEQGVHIDNIESNLVTTSARVEEGVSELKKAEKHQKSARKKMCCLAALILILAAVASIIVYVLAK